MFDTLQSFFLKAHEICSAVPESRALLHQMIEDNRVALAEARDKLHLQTAKQDSNDKEKTPTQEGLETI